MKEIPDLMTRLCEDNSMNITFLIGNGFDLHLGLKTSFSDFYDVYIELNKFNPDPIIKEFCTVLKNDCSKNGRYQNWSDFETAFPKYVKCAEDIQIILSDFSQKFYMYLKKIETNIVPISNNMAENFMNFVLESYKKIELPSELKIIGNLIKDSSQFTYNFVNFNYTNTLQILKNSIDDFRFDENILLPDISELHIHGSINESIIIGIDNVSQLLFDSSTEYDIGRYCVKREINDLMGNDNEELFSKIINQSDLIYIYGLSLGESDRSRRELIKKWFISNNAHFLVVFQHNPQFTQLNKAYYPSYCSDFERLKIDYLYKTFNLNRGRFKLSRNLDKNLIKRLSLIDSNSVLDFKLIKEKQTT